MYISGFLIIARTWKEPRCPSTKEKIKKMWSIHTMEYYSNENKNNDTMEISCKWMLLEKSIQRGNTDSERQK